MVNQSIDCLWYVRVKWIVHKINCLSFDTDLCHCWLDVSVGLYLPIGEIRDWCVIVPPGWSVADSLTLARSHDLFESLLFSCDYSAILLQHCHTTTMLLPCYYLPFFYCLVLLGCRHPSEWLKYFNHSRTFIIYPFFCCWQTCCNQRLYQGNVAHILHIPCLVLPTSCCLDRLGWSVISDWLKADCLLLISAGRYYNISV